eukprot:1257612-Pyramimonas_sp.AAC.1
MPAIGHERVVHMRVPCDHHVGGVLEAEVRPVPRGPHCLTAAHGPALLADAGAIHRHRASG